MLHALLIGGGVGEELGVDNVVLVLRGVVGGAVGIHGWGRGRDVEEGAERLNGRELSEAGEASKDSAQFLGGHGHVSGSKSS